MGELSGLRLVRFEGRKRGWLRRGNRRRRRSVANKVHLLGGIFRPQIDVQNEHGMLDITSKESRLVFCHGGHCFGGRLDVLAINLLPSREIRDYQPDTRWWGDGPAILSPR